MPGYAAISVPPALLRGFAFATVVAVAIGSAAGCNHAPDRPAIIESPTAESTAEIRGVLTEALGPRDILLAPDALTGSSILTLGSNIAQRDNIAGGRELGTPERFDLLLSDGRCVLVHAATGRRYPLERTDCVPFER